MSHELGWLEAVGAGLLQGVASVFPISGPGHAVVIGALGHGAGADVAPDTARYLYAVLRIAAALGLIAYFRRDWLRFGIGVARTATRPRRPRDDDRWVGLILLAAVPAVIAVAVLASVARPLLGRPAPAAVSLAASGVVLVAGWVWWRRAARPGGRSGSHRARVSRDEDSESFAVEIALSLRPYQAVLLGLLPVAMIVPGISGIGLALVAGVLWRLTHEQAVRVTLLVATPVLLVWGLLDLPDLTSVQYDPVRGPALAAGAAALVTAFLAAALLSRAFRRDSLALFGGYCLLAGGVAAVLL